jgi:hypothetical protein
VRGEELGAGSAIRFFAFFPVGVLQFIEPIVKLRFCKFSEADVRKRGFAAASALRLRHLKEIGELGFWTQMNL